MIDTFLKEHPDFADALRAAKPIDSIWVKTFKELMEELEELKKEKGVAFCLYCGLSIEVNPEEPEAAYQTLKDHDQACPKNPLLEKIRELKETLQGHEQRWHELHLLGGADKK